MSTPTQQQSVPQQQLDEKFSKQMQAKFMKDLQNIQIGDSDSELQASSEFYQGLKKKITTQITTMRQQSTTTNLIVQQLKATLTKQLTNAQQFEQEIKEMKYLNTQAKSAIAEEKIMQIKSMLKQTGNQSKIVLAEEIVELRESQLKGLNEDEAIFEQVQLQGEQQQQQQQQYQQQQKKQQSKTKRSMLKKSQKATTLISSSNSKPKLQQFKKKSSLLSTGLNNKDINNKIQKKLNEINLERERINMQRQDDRSMRYEKQCMSMFFSQRFIKFIMPKTQTMRMPQGNMLTITKPKSTFTNLQPLANNQKNVLPRNAPQIALKALKKSKRVSLKATSQTVVKIQFKKITNQEDVNNRGQKVLLNQLMLNNKNIHNYQQTRQQSQLSRKQSQTFTPILQPYLKQISSPLKQLHNISSIYKPKFIKNYLNENEKISNIAIMQQNDNDLNNKNKQRSIEQILSYEDGFDSDQGEINDSERDKDKLMGRLKQFKLTFQNVTNLKGIQKFTSVEYIALQYNQIKQISQLQFSKKLIELNLSNNIIKQTKSLQNLPQLRYLNLSNNKLRQFQFLGGSLEILDLKRNNIEIVNQLNNNKYLRIVDLTQNKLHQLGNGFKKLYYLQQLLLQKNYIESLQGIQNMLMLQVLDVSHNRLKLINQPLIYPFLNTLNLSYNQLESIPNMYLPSLQRLYITNNKLTGENVKQKIYYLPQLKQVNLDDNMIKGFSTVWAFISYSRKLEIVKYDSNEYFLSVREKVRELYQAIIYKYMSHLKIINNNPYDTGIKAYYKSVYGSYLQKSQQLSQVNDGLKNVQQFISCLLEENKVIANLQNRFSKQYNERFVKEEVFIKAKSISRAMMLGKVVGMLGESLKSGGGQQKVVIKGKKIQLPPTNKSLSSSSSSSSIIQINKQIYFYHDQFQRNLLKKVHKIKSLFYKFKYRKQKRRNYFIKQKQRLIKLFKPIEQFIFINKLKHVINAFSQSIRVNRQQQAAILIQKHWRGYRSRKLFKKLLKKLKQKDMQDDDFELQEVDLDEFEEHEFPQFNFDLPEDINFDNYIIEPKYFEIAQQKETKRRQLSKHTAVDGKNNKNLQQIQQQKQQQYNPMMKNFMKQQKKKQEKVKKKQQDQKLMKQWGFTNPATLQALRWKKKRKEQMKKKQAEQNMTAAQRYQRFKMMHK